METDIVLVTGDPHDPQVKSVLLVLDRSGLSYRVQGGRSAKTGPKAVMVTHRGESIEKFSDKELLEFLWAHGAKFEDS